MGSVDKFGRPLNHEPTGDRRSAALVEGLRMDSDKNYTALQKRIKFLADPEEDSDAVNMVWVRKQISQLEKWVGDTIDKAREMLMFEIASGVQIKTLDGGEVHPPPQDEYSIITDTTDGIKAKANE